MTRANHGFSPVKGAGQRQSVSYTRMQSRLPDPDSLSDDAIRMALANNAVEGFPLLDWEGKPVAFADRVSVFRENLRRLRQEEERRLSNEG